jgi:hypothetical protein
MPEDRLLVIPAERLTFAPYPGRKVLVNIDFPSDVSLWNLRPPKPGQLRELYFVRPTRRKYQSARLHHFTVSAVASPSFKLTVPPIPAGRSRSASMRR